MNVNGIESVPAPLRAPAASAGSHMNCAPGESDRRGSCVGADRYVTSRSGAGRPKRREGCSTESSLQLGDGVIQVQKLQVNLGQTALKPIHRVQHLYLLRVRVVADFEIARHSSGNPTPETLNISQYR